METDEIRSKMHAFSTMDTDNQLATLYREILLFRAMVEGLEKRAAEMANPDKLMEMAGNLLGGGFGGKSFF